MPVLYLGGKPIEVSDDQVEAALAQGYTPESSDQHAQRLTAEQREADHGGVKGKIAAGVAAGLRGVTLGGSDLAIDAFSGGQHNLADLREVNPGVSLAGEIVGGLSPVGAAGWASRLGQRIAKTAEGTSLGTKVIQGAKGYGAEGVMQGLGQAATEVALSDDLTAERFTSILTSNVLLGGGIGAGAGTIGKLAEGGLLRAKSHLDEIAASSRIGSDVTGDLASMDAKALRGAEKAELEAIEKARVPQRAEVANEIAALRKEMKDQKVWLASKGAKTWEGADDVLKKEMSEVGKVSLEADRQLDRLLRNPKAMASKPGRALDALQQQEAALERLTAQRDNLAGVFAKDASGERLAALDSAAKALERNRALQQRIADLGAAPASERLTAITGARDALSMPQAPQGIGERMASGTAYSMGATAAAAIPVVGPFIAPFVGSAAANAVGERVFGRLAKGAAEVKERSAKAIAAFLDVSGKVAPKAPVLATKVLASLRYGEEKPTPRGSKPAAPPTSLAGHYHARAEELRSQTMYGPAGKPVMRPEARIKLGDRLDPIRTVNPVLADRMETLAARRVEFLADKLPRRPDLQALVTGPDRWQPSDMEMRQFARYAAAVEDPGAIEERLASGQVTPEDAEVMREVYPERYAEIQRELTMRLPELRATLPYQRRLSLSIFSGVPIDPAMNPQILAVLQSNYASEDAGGPPGPMPQPQFGSVKKSAPEPTPAQARAGGAV